MSRQPLPAAELEELPPVRSSVGVALGRCLGGRYRLDELLARGATADVYSAHDELLDRPVAIKVFDSAPSELNSQHRQRLEMRVLASLSHPNLVAVYDGSIGSNEPDEPRVPRPSYLVMELVQGLTLADLIRSSDAGLGADHVQRIGRALAAALAVVHARGFIHRDVKPANILIAVDGTVKLSDFGLARILRDDRLTSGPLLMGTAPYFSPEQVHGEEIGPASDIYALGLVLLEALTGERVFPGDAVESALARLSHDPVVPSDLSPSLRGLLTAMTSALRMVTSSTGALVTLNMTKDSSPSPPSSTTFTLPSAASARNDVIAF